MKQLFTISQLARQNNVKDETVAKILRGYTPDGSVSRWPGYSEETYEAAKKKYYEKLRDNVNGEIDGDTPIGKDTPPDLSIQIQQADLRAKLARAEALEIDNQERKHNLVDLKKVEHFVSFQSRLFANKLRELTRDKGDDYYNVVVEEIYKEIEAYVNEEGIGNIVQPKILLVVENDLYGYDDFAIWSGG